MTKLTVAFITYPDIAQFSGILVIVTFGLIAYAFYEWWLRFESSSPCPYTGKLLRKGSDLPYVTREKVLRYLYDMREYDNRMFDLSLAAYCRQTGRVFPNCLTWYGALRVDWSFLQKRYPGRYVSWGSLTKTQQENIRKLHKSLDGFQTEYSSPRSSPREIEPQFAHTVPGPLYVDVDTGVVMGWQEVPDTDLEVLIVQKPKKEYLLGTSKRE